MEDRGSSLRAGGHKRFGSDQVKAFAFSETGEVRGELYFAGYGIRVPESAGVRYDSYAGHEVRDKVVVVLRYFPDDVEDETRSVLNRHADFRSKASAARDQGAAGMVMITGPGSEGAGELAPDGFDISAPGSQGILAVSIDGAAGDRLFAGTGVSLAEVQRSLDSGEVDAGSFPLPGFATLAVDLERTPTSGANVVGILPAADGSLDPPYVAVGAHYDHLGMGGGGSLNPHAPPAVHPGADDNASGTAAVLALARTVADSPLARPVLVGFWSGEESGLLGSRAFLRDAIRPDQLAAYINLDMVGRLEENRLTVQAMGSSSVWPGIVERANVPGGFDLALSDDPYLPTDSSAFNSESVPTLNLFTGTHPDYHRPSDTADKLNYEGLARIARFTGLVARRVAESDPVPEFVEVERAPETATSRVSLRAYTGTIPEYATEIEGLLLGGVMAVGRPKRRGCRRGRDRRVRGNSGPEHLRLHERAGGRPHRRAAHRGVPPQRGTARGDPRSHGSSLTVAQHQRSGSHRTGPQLLHHRAHRSREVHARRPAHPALRRGQRPRVPGPVAGLDGPRARARDHHQVEQRLAPP